MIEPFVVILAGAGSGLRFDSDTPKQFQKIEGKLVIDYSIDLFLSFKECKKIIKGEVDVINLSNDMFETMSQADGIGLAAPQIGISKRIFVVDGTTNAGALELIFNIIL